MNGVANVLERLGFRIALRMAAGQSRARDRVPFVAADEDYLVRHDSIIAQMTNATARDHRAMTITATLPNRSPRMMNPRFFMAKRDDDPTGDLRDDRHRDRLVGQVISVQHQKGYGFLLSAGAQYFFHRSGFADPRDWDELVAGSYVTFEVGQPRPGKGPRAEHLELT